MNFQWDPQKSLNNNEKHGIDFETATALWKDEQQVEIEAPYPIENRYIIIATLHDKLWSAIFTHRQTSIRIISVRRARKKERELYEQQQMGG